MPNQPQFKTQTSKIPYEGPTRYEILHLISRYNAAHHEVDHIHATSLTDVDRAAVESLVTLDRERLFKHNPVDRELDILLRDIQQVKQISTEKDCKSIDWERLIRGAKVLKTMSSSYQGNGLKGLAKHAGIELDQRQAAAKGDAGKQLAKSTSNTNLQKRLEEMMDAVRGGGKQIRKSQSHANFGERPAKEDRVQGARQDRTVQWMDTEVRRSDCPHGCLDWWMLPTCVHRGTFAKERPKGRSPTPHPQREAQGNGARPATPGPAKLQNPMFDIKFVRTSGGLKVPMFLPVPQGQTGAKSPANQGYRHTKDNHHQQRPKSPGLQPSANHHTRPKSPSLPQPVKRNVQLPTTQGTVYQPPPKTYIQSPKKHTVYQQTAKHNVATPTQDITYARPPKLNKPRPKSPAPQQHGTPYIPGQLNRPKGNANLRQAAANDPTKDPGNKAMYNKRPRIVTEIKDLKMQKAHDEALRLASEIRKMD